MQSTSASSDQLSVISKAKIFVTGTLLLNLCSSKLIAVSLISILSAVAPDELVDGHDV